MKPSDRQDKDLASILDELYTKIELSILDELYTKIALLQEQVVKLLHGSSVADDVD